MSGGDGKGATEAAWGWGAAQSSAALSEVREGEVARDGGIRLEDGGQCKDSRQRFKSHLREGL